MPVMRCTLKGGGSGWKYGESGTCYADKQDAIKQGLAISYSEGHGGKLERMAKRLLKEFSSPGGPTTGLAGYSLEGQKKPGRLGRMARRLARMKARRQPAEKADIDTAAHRAATSPNNTKRYPSERQRASGNYAKGHLKIAGIKIAIENPDGSVRKPHQQRMPAHYGYIKRTEGADGDELDAFVKVGTPENWAGSVHVIDQVHPQTREFDEHKVMLGWERAEDAKADYLRAYQPGWNGIGAMTTVPMPEFKQWLKDGDLGRPFHSQRVPQRRDGAQLDVHALTPLIV